MTRRNVDSRCHPHRFPALSKASILSDRSPIQKEKKEKRKKLRKKEKQKNKQRKKKKEEEKKKNGKNTQKKHAHTQTRIYTTVLIDCPIIFVMRLTESRQRQDDELVITSSDLRLRNSRHRLTVNW